MAELPAAAPSWPSLFRCSGPVMSPVASATNAGTGDRYLYQAPCLNRPGLCWSVIAPSGPLGEAPEARYRPLLRRYRPLWARPGLFSRSQSSLWELQPPELAPDPRR